ncbi:carboxylating nicotinate-nucleotide diphosphorylase [Methanobacterium sp.]|uniref:carboxylating nicotinate-nucleotide diphosphorylase n=1 Tax=Methanobacterium sp. TaxID=2164 RepID=UPI003C78B255
MRDILKQMVYEDIGFEDITSNALIPKDLETKGILIAKEKGIISGIDVVADLLNEFKIKSKVKKYDGDSVKVNDIIMEIKGNARTILSLERTVLNFLMRMSGIATLTFNTIGKIREVNKNIILAGTRKTTPGLQIFEKNAVKVGGGDTHRFRLDDSVLIKDNHVAIVGSIKDAVIIAKNNVSFTKKIEIEVEDEKGALDAAKAGADIIMLDNMNPEEIKHVISALESRNLRDNILIEISGGIKPENIVEYAKTNADIISTGYITHSARSLDLSLEIL